MIYYVYILYSRKTSAFYKGQTRDVHSRLDRHNQGKEDYTSKGRPWTLLWYCSKESRSGSLALEKKLKNLSRKRLISFMQKYEEGIAGPDEMVLLDHLSGC
ncbi:MAG: GIY-YIG nuclease family protein [Chlorobi bacterium]|nr:GIY-YIG nuclease family protein [Chlorobiota bacterium]